MRTLTIIAAAATTAVIGWLAIIATVLSAVIDNIAAISLAIAVCAALAVLRRVDARARGPRARAPRPPVCTGAPVAGNPHAAPISMPPRLR